MTYNEIILRINEYLDSDIRSILYRYNYTNEMNKLAEKISNNIGIQCEITDNNKQLNVIFKSCNLEIKMESITTLVQELNDQLYEQLNDIIKTNNVYKDTFDIFINNILFKGDDYDEDDFDSDFEKYISKIGSDYDNCCKELAYHILVDDYMYGSLIDNVESAITTGNLDYEVFHRHLYINSKLETVSQIVQLYKCLQETNSFYLLNAKFDDDKDADKNDFLRTLYEDDFIYIDDIAKELSDEIDVKSILINQVNNMSNEEAWKVLNLINEDINSPDNEDYTVKDFTDKIILDALVTKL